MKKYLVAMVVCVGLFIGSLSFVVLMGSGCQAPPPGTTVTEVEGKPTLVQDADHDLSPDVGEDGNPIVIGDGAQAIYGIADKVDTFAPIALETAAGLFGIPVLGLIASLLRNNKLGKQAANLVASFQQGRQAILDGGFDGAPEVLDITLKGSQAGDTVALVQKIKRGLHVGSVQ